MSWITEFILNETKDAERRGIAFKEKLMKEYPEGLKGTISKPHMMRMKMWDSVKKKANRSWNIVAWADDRGYEHNLKNELLWRLYLVFPVRWEKRNQLKYFEDAGEIVYQCKFYKDDGTEYPFTISLFESQVKSLAGKKVTIKKYGCIGHRFHKYLIGYDYEIYPQDIEVEE